MSDSRPLGKVICCLELAWHSERGSDAYSLIISIPGRDGTFVRTWKTLQQLLDDEQVADVEITVSKSVVEAILLHGGIQQALLPQ